MSSENLQADDRERFLWNEGLSALDYVQATYLITTPVDGKQAALGLAREQSICATSLPGVEMPGDIDSYCARVVQVQALTGSAAEIAPEYFLNTPVYGPCGEAGVAGHYKVQIAYPITLFGHSITRLWNSVFGEVHRLGFLRAASLIDLQFPAAFASAFPGPRHGVAGIRQLLGITDRPLFCRSMRPASGLSTQLMAQINEQVLGGGFDIIKDDELTYDSSRSPFAERVERMVSMKRRVEDATGERKLYFANIIDDLAASLAMAEQAAELGADGVLLSSAAQGLSFISEVSRRTGLIILSHNSCGDAITRPDCWGASDAVMAMLQRAAGADLVVSPGPFATPYQDPAEGQAFLSACRDEPVQWAPALPIIQGGKQPEHLADYTAAVGSIDYMIIAATWLDNHPRGIGAGAQAFRQAWDGLTQNEAAK